MTQFRTNSEKQQGHLGTAKVALLCVERVVVVVVK